MARRRVRLWVGCAGLLALLAAVRPLSAAPLVGDLNGDGRVDIQDVFKEIRLLVGLDPSTPALIQAGDVFPIGMPDGKITFGDALTLIRVVVGLTPLADIQPKLTGTVTTILQTSPANGETGVDVIRETEVKFSGPVNPDTVKPTNFFAAFAGQKLPARIHVSPMRLTATLYYAQPLPAGSRIRVTIDGSSILDASGHPIDAAGNGTMGSMGAVDFDTISLSTLPSVQMMMSTSVCGRVFASEKATTMAGAVNVPLAGVNVTVDGMEDVLHTTTDNMGNFRLDPAPVGKFFVHIDGRQAPRGIMLGGYYPFVAKQWQALPGAETNVGNIFLPFIPPGTLQPVSQTQDTMILPAPSVMMDNPQLAGLRLTVPANSLFAENGSRGGLVGIAPVAPDRLPAPLPIGLKHVLDITVQSQGGTDFDVPAPICFPNLPDPDTGMALPPGAKSALMSYNHKAARWEMIGPMTVTPDGKLICTDPGVGVLQPGWHGTQQTTSGCGGGTNGGLNVLKGKPDPDKSVTFESMDSDCKPVGSQWTATNGTKTYTGSGSTFTLPGNAPPGNYTVTATGNGTTATASHSK